MPSSPKMAVSQEAIWSPADLPPPQKWRAFWRSVVSFQKEKITPWLALRNTLGVVLPLAVGIAAGAVPVAIALATGAMNVSYSDSHEPYIQRSRKMLAASFLVGLAVSIGALIGRNHPIAVLVAGGWAFVAGIMVALSSTAGDLGVISLVTLVVYSAVPQTPERAAYAGLLALAGGLFQTFLSIAFWPLHRYNPERRALGRLFLELSQTAASPVEVLRAPPASAPINQAQTALAALDRDRSVEAERYRSLLNQSERMRLNLLLLGRLRIRLERQHPGGLAGDLLDTYFAACSRVLLALGNTLMSGEPMVLPEDRLQHLQRLADDLRGWDPGTPEAGALINDARLHMDALNGQIRSAVDLARNVTPEGGDAFARREASRPWRLRLIGTLATLRANLGFESTAFRHAVRMAVCVAIGDALGRSFSLRRSYWLPMTIAIVLKPDFGATFSRGVLRVAGTLIGLVLATALFHLLHPSMAAEVLLIAAYMFTLRCFGSANYGIFVILVTGLVVVLIALTGVEPKAVMLARAINTVAGGVIALLAYWLWPTWERSQAPDALARMLDAYRKYFRAIREAYLNPDSAFAEELDRARVAARLARSNLEASIERLSAEPGTARETVRLLSSMLASSHRLIHALMALEAGLATNPVPARSGFRPFANDVELTLYYLAAALRGSPLTRESLPDLREDHHALIHSAAAPAERYALVNVETDRITNSLNTLSEQVLTWRGANTRQRRQA